MLQSVGVPDLSVGISCNLPHNMLKETTGIKGIKTTTTTSTNVFSVLVVQRIQNSNSSSMSLSTSFFQFCTSH